MSKYRNIRVGSNASKKEGWRAYELRTLANIKEISNLKEQVPFLLIPAQYGMVDGKRKCLERSTKYIADFTYNDSEGNFIVEDTKSEATRKIPSYVMKRKLMLQVHGIKIKET